MPHCAARGALGAGRWSVPLLGRARCRGMLAAGQIRLELIVQAPDMSVDPKSKILTLINPSKAKKSFVVTVPHKCFDKLGQRLQQATSADNAGNTTTCTTLLAVLTPSSFVDVCRIKVASIRNLQIYSDVHVVIDHPAPGLLDEATPTVAFPLRGGPFLCTQGINGALTHFQLGTYHAIDFACPIGTPVLSVADGVVVRVQDTNRCSGIHVQNLFAWNSITVRLDSGLFAEYVHIHTGSALVAVGTRVAAGQPLCASGSVGFSPEPHLHLQMHSSDTAEAPTILFALRDANGEAYVPEAGRWYVAAGRVPEHGAGMDDNAPLFSASTGCMGGDHDNAADEDGNGADDNDENDWESEEDEM
jgi:hypothetical protein